jgi:hypothetical protein
MAEPSLFAMLQDYGWVGLALYVVLEKVWPSFWAWVLPERKRMLDSKAKLEELERERIRTLEERQVAAFEKVAEAVRNLVSSMVQVNEKLGHIESAFAVHHQATSDAIADMRTARAVRGGRQAKAQ